MGRLSVLVYYQCYIGACRRVDENFCTAKDGEVSRVGDGFSVTKLLPLFYRLSFSTDFRLITDTAPYTAMKAIRMPQHFARVWRVWS